MAPRSSLRGTINNALNTEVEVDFSAARDGDFSPITPGKYRAKVVKAEAGTSKEGNPKVVFQFEIADGEEFAGRIFFKHCPTRGAGSGILRDTLRGLGFDVDGMTKFNPADAINREANITVRFQKGSDEFQEISKVEALPGARKPVTSSDGTKQRSSRI
jgi:hypothetical protein